MKLLWLDIETTGLNPYRDVILEVAARLATLDDPFGVVASFESVIHFDNPIFRATCRPAVEEMHTRNGLWDDCLSSETTLEEAEQGLLRLMRVGDDLVAIADRSMSILAGSSVHFDLGFLREKMPRLACEFSHRVYDVSAVTLFCRSLGMPKPARKEVHRAAADIDESIDLARQCANWISA